MRNPSILHTLHAPKPTGNFEAETRWKDNKNARHQKETAREVLLEKAAAERKLARDLEIHDAELAKAHDDACFPAPSIAPSVAPSASPPAHPPPAHLARDAALQLIQARATVQTSREATQVAMSRLHDKRQLAIEERAERVRELASKRKRELDAHEIASNGVRSAQREALAAASKRARDNVWGLLETSSSSSSSSSLFTVAKARDNYVPTNTHKVWNSSTKKSRDIWRSARK
jgi:hypothetical protein